MHVFNQRNNMTRMWHKICFLAEFTGFDFILFLLRTNVYTKVEIACLSCYFTQIWKENRRIPIFPNGYSAIWNVNSLIQVLNLGQRFYSLRR